MNQDETQRGGNVFSKLMSMDDATWARHANPWSVWTRVVTGLPIMLLAVWSIRPLAWWSFASVGTACFWLWINPRLFSIPRNTDNWASKVTFGERVWLNRSTCPIPNHHAQWALFLSVVAGVGFLIAIVGAVFNMLLPTLSGGLVSWFGKMWFCDRMVWLYEDMKDVDSEYRSWLSIEGE
ncbi:MAG: hypothetical protein HOE48_00880 [Candidatus Latescibacteria bacterium]|mgnify:FL=1|jgi:hypothetical protein|nr:hypothetical protein [Candidatus Latescibacterota bacterium]MBT4136429.1 hypothetical protein [Candidatus Latescibacterota bacterium]MBT5829592.1 hypothetical protein [Candidatus Latescibacterota bacterium]